MQILGKCPTYSWSDPDQLVSIIGHVAEIRATTGPSAGQRLWPGYKVLLRQALSRALGAGEVERLGNPLPTLGRPQDLHFCAFGGASECFLFLGLLLHWWLLLRGRDRFSWTCCKQYTAPTSHTHATLFSQNSVLCLFHSRHPQYVSSQKPLHPCHLHAAVFETLLTFPHLPRPTTRPSPPTGKLTHAHAPQVTGHIPAEAHSAQW